MLLNDDTCPYCDSMDYTRKDKTKMFCRDCGEEWVELDDENPSVSESFTD